MNILLPPRPPLQVRRGTCFQYAVPQGWRAVETGVGVDLRGTEPGVGASLTLVLGAAGLMSPQKYLGWVLQVLRLAAVDLVSSRERPDEPGPFGLAWKVTETILTHTLRGSTVQVALICGICQDGARYSAAVRMYQVPTHQWAGVQHWLPLVAQSICMTDSHRLVGQTRCPLPRAACPDSIYHSYHRIWHDQGVEESRIHGSLQRAAPGYERVVDPVTGQVYELPLEMYNPAKGGYRNPGRPDEWLVHKSGG